MTTIYTKPGCVQCDRTQAQFTKKDLPYKTRDVVADPEAYRFITDGLGYQQVPVVVTDDGENWSGFRPDKINQLAARRHSPNAAETTSAGPIIDASHLGR